MKEYRPVLKKGTTARAPPSQPWKSDEKEGGTADCSLNLLLKPHVPRLKLPVKFVRNAPIECKVLHILDCDFDSHVMWLETGTATRISSRGPHCKQYAMELRPDDPAHHFYIFESAIRTDRMEEATQLVPELNEAEAATGLWYASLYGRCELIPLLVEKLKEFGSVENYIANNIMVNQSISVAAEKGMLRAIKLLMAIGLSLETLNADKMTLLHSAAAHDHAKVVVFCLEHGIKADALDRQGNVALHYAAHHSSEATARVILQHHNNEDYLNLQNNEGFTPLDEAFRHCSLAVAEFLMSHKARLNNVKRILEKDQSGLTALHEAVKVGNIDVVRFLCENRVPLRALDMIGNTALHTAAEYNHPEIVGLLVNSGIALIVRNENGDTALTIARKNQFDVCADIIARATNHRLVSVYGVCNCEDITIGVGGSPGAGKTTLIASFGRSYLWSLVTKEGGKDLEDKEISSRTRGIRIVRLKDPLGGPIIYHFLDFGGHQEYIPSHSLFISECTTPAMVICLVNSNKPEETLVEEMELWCGVFISCHRLKEEPPEPVESDNEEYPDTFCYFDSDDEYPRGPTPKRPQKQKAKSPTKDKSTEELGDKANGAAKPAADSESAGEAAGEDTAPLKMPFLLVVTRHDTDEGRAPQIEAVMRAYAKIKAKFQHRLAFEDQPVFLDARRSHATGLKEVRSNVQRLSSHLLQHTVKTPQLIHAVRKVLPDVRRRIGWPFTSRDDFREKLLDVLQSQKTGKDLENGVRSLMDPVLQLLSCCGELVVFNSPELQHLVVLKADWLLTDIVGHLCSPRYFRQPISFNEEARADRKKVERVLSGLGGPGDLILMMIESIGICIIDENEVILPSKLPDRGLDDKQTQLGLWEKDSHRTTYSGIFFKCDEGLPMSPGVAPLMQTKCYNHFKKEHGTASYLWRRGIRVQPICSEVQGTVCVAPSRLGIFIACRGPKRSQRHQYALIQILSKIVREVVSSVSPGTKLQKLILSPTELAQLVEKRSSVYPSVFYSVEEAVDHMKFGRDIIMPENSARNGITDNVVDLLFHLQDSHVHFISDNSLQELSAVLLTPTFRSSQYRTWIYLAEHLGFSPLDIERMRNLPDPVKDMLDRWARSGYNNSIQELRRLCSEINYDAARVLDIEARQPFHGIPNLFTAQRELYEYNRELHRQAIASQKEEDGSGKKKQPRRGSGGGKQRDKGPKVGQRVTFTPQVQVRMYDEQTQSPADTTVGEAQPSDGAAKKSPAVSEQEPENMLLSAARSEDVKSAMPELSGSASSTAAPEPTPPTVSREEDVGSDTHDAPLVTKESVSGDTAGHCSNGPVEPVTTQPVPESSASLNVPVQETQPSVEDTFVFVHAAQCQDH